MRPLRWLTAISGLPQFRSQSPFRSRPNGRWFADLSPVGGPVLGPFHQRTQALRAEYAWLETNWIVAETENDHYQGDLFLSHPRQCENENREFTKEFDGLRWREMRLKE